MFNNLNVKFGIVTTSLNRRRAKMTRTKLLAPWLIMDLGWMLKFTQAAWPIHLTVFSSYVQGFLESQAKNRILRLELWLSAQKPELPINVFGATESNIRKSQIKTWTYSKLYCNISKSRLTNWFLRSMSDPSFLSSSSRLLRGIFVSWARQRSAPTPSPSFCRIAVLLSTCSLTSFTSSIIRRWCSTSLQKSMSQSKKID